MTLTPFDLAVIEYSRQTGIPSEKIYLRCMAFGTNYRDTYTEKELLEHLELVKRDGTWKKTPDGDYETLGFVIVRQISGNYALFRTYPNSNQADASRKPILILGARSLKNIVT